MIKYENSLKKDKYKYVFNCMNAFIDGLIINKEDITHANAIIMAINYEATLYLIKNDVEKILVYDPYDCFN